MAFARGDRVQTPRGPGTVAGFYTEPRRPFDLPRPRQWVIVELDDGSRGLVPPTDLEPEQLELHVGPHCESCGVRLFMAEIDGQERAFERAGDGTYELWVSGADGHHFLIAHPIGWEEQCAAQRRHIQLYRRHAHSEAA